MVNIKTCLRKLHHLSFTKQPEQLPKKIINLAEIKINWLKAAGIRGVILDLDNTIVSEDDRYLTLLKKNYGILMVLLVIKSFCR